ncbi:MAG: M56 family metallopeptidase [Flavobacteriaceae bacterium]
MDTFIYILKSASILTLFYLVYRIVLQKDTFFTANRHFLISGIIASLLFPLLIFTKTIYIDAPVSNTFVNFNNASNIHPISEASATSIDIWAIITVIYLIGIVFMSFRFLKQLFSLYQLIGSQTVTISNGFKYVKTNENISPFSFFKYIVYNPEKHSEADLKMILKHEQAHATQLHSVDIILSNLLLIMQWMNPFAWLYKKGIEENLEFLADNETIQNVSSKTAYQITMLKSVTSKSLQPLLANNFYQSIIKKRIIMLQKNQSATKNQWKLLLILPFLGVFLWSFNVEEVIKYNDYATPEVSKTVETEIPSEEITIPSISEATKPKVDNNVVISNKINKQIDSKITVSVNKNTTDAELENLKRLFKENYQVDLKFTGVKRNSSGEITVIKVKMKSEKSSSNYAINDDKAINEFSISYDKENNSMSIGNNNSHDLHFNPKAENSYVYEIKEDNNGAISTWASSDGKHKTKHKNKYVIHSSEDHGDGEHEIHVISESSSDSKVWVSKDGKVSKNVNHTIIVERDEDKNALIIESYDNDSIFVKSDGKSGIFISDDKSGSMAVYINGKKSSVEEMEKLGDTIETIEVLKGDDVVEKYGKEAKDGVILITTKNK